MLTVHPCETRPNWKERLAAGGLVYNDTDDPNKEGEVLSYWVEGRYYGLTQADQAMMNTAVSVMNSMMIAAYDYVIDNNLYHLFGILPWAVPAIELSWRDDHPDYYWPSIIGRYDVRWGGTPEQIAADPSLAVPKFLEYNADTPVSFVESTQVQWDWHQDTPGFGDQWNGAWEACIDAWQRNIGLHEQRTGRKVTTIHFAWSRGDTSGEDWLNAAAYAAAAEAAGYKVKVISLEKSEGDGVFLHQPPGVPNQVVGSDGVAFDIGQFRDADNDPIHVMWKLYPWDQLLSEPWGRTWLWSMQQKDGTVLAEPPYKMLWNNKAIWAILWKMFKDDPYKSRFLLPAYFEGEQPEGFTDYIRKPLHGREGSGMQIFRGGKLAEETANTHESAGREGYIVQELAPLPVYETLDGPRHVVLGLWVGDNDPSGACGLSIRESAGLITDYYSYFVPHRIRTS